MRPALFSLLLLSLGAAGCGYKGPLYLPKDKPAAAKPAAPAVPAEGAARQP